MRAFRLALLLAISTTLWAVDPTAESSPELLTSVRQGMREAMKRLPDFTCTENVESRVFLGSPPRLQSIDRIRLAVAVIGGREAFAWPDNSRFDSPDPLDILGPSAVGAGDFAGFANTVFASDVPTFTGGSIETRAGREVVRFDYRVATQLSRYLLRAGSQAFVGYHGSFWVDPIEAKILALEVQANDIPPQVALARATTRIEYGMRQIGARKYPVPIWSELDMMERTSGRSVRNSIAFTDCHTYTSSSTITFGEKEAALAGMDKTAALPGLPAGIKLDVTLDTAIDISSTAAGDRITATLVRPARAGSLRIPAQAKLVGRVLQLYISIAGLQTLIAFEFNQLQFDGRSIPFSGHPRSQSDLPGIVIATGQSQRHVATLTARDSVTRIEPGLRMTWETTAPMR